MEKLTPPIRKLVEDLGYELYDVVFEQREEGPVLSVLIDHASGIDIDDCVAVSESVSLYLDETDPIPESYSLEVTSAGAERLLRNHEEIHRAIGKFIYLETMDQQYEGTLLSLDQDTLTLMGKNRQKTTVLLAELTVIRLAVNL
ncbi:MAG: ribosome maturation factor RimP [Acholeplasmatales bacterium]|nr:MAG: ribosome maturation factor RimP [Acholeplasmatales bacterium]